MSRALYQISADLTLLLLQVEENDGEMNEELMTALDGTLVDMSDKADQVLCYAVDLEGDEQKFREEAKRLAMRADILKRSRESLKEYVRRQLEAAGIKKFPTEHFPGLRRQNNPPSVEVPDESAIEDRFVWGVLEKPYGELSEADRQVAKRKIDKKAILEVLKAGEDVFGASMRQGEHLRYK